MIPMRWMPLLSGLCVLGLAACEAEDPENAPSDAAVSVDGVDGGQGGAGGQGGQGGAGGGGDTQCGGMLGGVCGADEFCDFASLGCDWADATGLCRPRPEDCAEIYAPVCGCDGNTYGNECAAHAAGIDAAAEGPCGGVECTPEDCGPEPDVARCPGGGGPSVACEIGPDGACGWQIGQCPQDVCGTIEGLVCDAGFFCDYEGDEPMGCGVPDAGGQCRPIPQGCPEHEDPVCGCDGNTYSNDCMADMAGVDTQHRGACEGPCDLDGACGGPPPPVSVECPDGSDVGFECAPDDAGVCAWREQACPPVDLCALPFEVGPCDAAIPQWAYNPALGACEMFVYGGCEGNANRFETQQACEARCGEPAAPVSCGGRAGDTCGEGEFCDFARLGCDWADAQGTCRPRPEACIELYAPVCGCDGQTYDNECFAQAAGSDAAAEGPCDAPSGPVCGGRGNAPCPEGTFCNFPPQNICGAADGPGTCTPVPQGCDDIFAPVCGCDDQTHSNACEAASLRVSVLREGPCELPELCGLPAVVGDCEAAMPRWFHNAATGQCEEFVYGGCGGNENNFMSREACEGACPPRR